MRIEVEWWLFGLIAWAILLLIMIIKKIGRGAVNVVFGSFLSGVILLGESRLLLDLGDRGVYSLSEASLHIWWHSIFYLSMLSFIWGGKRTKEIASAKIPEGFGQRDARVLGTMQGLGLLVFVLAPRLEPMIERASTMSLIGSWGLHHLLAMILGIMAASYMFYIQKNWGQVLSAGVGYWIWFLALMGIQHLWELLTESWGIIGIDSDSVERVEWWLVCLGVIGAITALWKVKKVLYGR